MCVCVCVCVCVYVSVCIYIYIYRLRILKPIHKLIFRFRSYQDVFNLFNSLRSRLGKNNIWFRWQDMYSFFLFRIFLIFWKFSYCNFSGQIIFYIILIKTVTKRINSWKYHHHHHHHHLITSRKCSETNALVYKKLIHVFPIKSPISFELSLRCSFSLKITVDLTRAKQN